MMIKAKVPKTLDEQIFSWLEKSKTLKLPGRPPNPKTSRERQRYYYIRRVAWKEIEDLTKLAELLPEDQLKQIFNEERLRGFFRALFKLDAKQLKEDPKLIIEKRRRLLPLCYELITLLNDINFASSMAPTYYNAIAQGQLPLAPLMAVFLRSQIQNIPKLEE